MYKITIGIRTNRVQYSLDLHSKFTIIRGDSGTGKTTLIQLLSNAATEIDCVMPIEVMPTRIGYLKQLKSHFEHNFDVPHVIVVDESSDFLRSIDFQIAARESKHLFIFLSRNRLASIPYAVSDVYRLSHSGKLTVLSEHYEARKVVLNDRVRYMCTEDSGSGFNFFSEVIKNTASISTAHGKDNISEKILQVSNTLFIMDELGAGNVIESVYRALDETVNNHLLLIPSFEALVYKSEFINGIDCPDCFSANKEDFYERALSEVLKRAGLSYSKSGTVPCFIQDCCYRQKCSLYKREAKQPMILGIYLSVFDRLRANIELLSSCTTTNYFTPPK